FVSDNGGPFTPFLTDTTASSANFPGEVGHSYGFFSRARNLAGVVEPLKNQPDASTKVTLLPFALSVKPRILHFGKVPVGSHRKVKKIPLANHHRNKMGFLLKMVTDSGIFSKTNDCPTPLERGKK